MPIVQAKNVKIGGRAILYEVHGDAVIFQFGDGQYSEGERDMIRDHISNTMAFKLPDINDIIRKHSLNQSIITLPRPQVAYNDYQNKAKIGPCFNGTRVSLLQEIANWVSGIVGTNMYVLSGLAGIGKSTVAYTVAARADELGLLGASFFFSRDHADRKNAQMFFTAIAYQLCLYSDLFSQAIGAALLTKRGSAATMKDPQEQLEAFIVDPLQGIVESRTRPILIVIDALDECKEEDGLSVLAGLSQLVRTLSYFNVILTMRPQPHFDHLLSNQNDHKIFYLQDIEDKVVDDDIRIYLKHNLSLEQVKKRFPRRKWSANNKEIDFLVHAAGRLFIIASTAVRFILDKVVSNPAAQMQKLLCASAQGHIPFKDLDEFYTIILRNVVPVDYDDDGIVDRYRSIVGAIISVQRPLPITTLANLIAIDAEDIYAVLDNLQSVILLGDDDIPQIYHKSFPDYITDSKRCKDISLYIDTRDSHTNIAIRCFQTMEQHLRYNILDLSDLARFMSNEDGLATDGILDKRLQEKISEQLQYACVYWANHLQGTNIEDDDLRKELEKFVDDRMLNWFEALSLIGKLDTAHHAIRVTLKLSILSPDLRQLVSDGLRFISKFYETIKRSALHTYYSALAFTPIDSLLYDHYINGAIHDICHAIGGPNKWDALVAHLMHGEEVNHVQFSFDNTMFASQSSKGDKSCKSKGILKFWDAASGTPISTIRGNGFAIANDFSTVVSFKDTSITSYNKNGSELGVSLTTRAEILGVAISSESNRIAAISSDGTVCLWDSSNGELVGTFGDYESNSYDRNRLQFSTTGTRLAYASANHVVKLRNGLNGRFIADLDCGSDDFAFSRDGSRIAALRSWSELKLWSCENAELIGIAENAGQRLAISANGSYVATRGGSMVKLWSSNSGHSLPLIQVLTFNPLSITFALDDALAITTLSDIKIYNAKARYVPRLSFTGSPGAPVAFSSDCSHLAAGNSNGAIYLWNSQGIYSEESSPSNKQASRRITALSLSPDCSRVVYGFTSGAIELMETGGFTKQQIATNMYHPVEITTLGFSPDSRRFASGSRDGTIKSWESEDRALRGTVLYRSLLGSFGWLYAVEVSNSVLAAAGNKGIVLWDPTTLDHIHTFEGSFMAPLSFSANGALLVATVRDNKTPRI